MLGRARQPDTDWWGGWLAGEYHMATYQPAGKHQQMRKIAKAGLTFTFSLVWLRIPTKAHTVVSGEKGGL